MKKGVLGFIMAASGLASGFIITKSLTNKSIKESALKINKFKSYYNILNLWIIAKNEKKSFGSYLIDNGYKNIAIYGMGELGNRLLEELDNSTINILYGIDSLPTSTSTSVVVYNYTDELPEVDAVIVTTSFIFDEIKYKLQDKLNCPIISLEDLVKCII